jgi:hypothetical protein
MMSIVFHSEAVGIAVGGSLMDEGQSRALRGAGISGWEAVGTCYLLEPYEKIWTTFSHIAVTYGSVSML